MTTFTTQDRQDAQRTPLTDEKIKQLFSEETGFNFDDNPADGMALMEFARAIERAHGIGE